MFITLPEGDPSAFAGLWETWNKKDAPDNPRLFCIEKPGPPSGL
jgi:putative SOS response-associated peptidase YedK